MPDARDDVAVAAETAAGRVSTRCRRIAALLSIPEAVQLLDELEAEGGMSRECDGAGSMAVSGSGFLGVPPRALH